MKSAPACSQLIADWLVGMRPTRAGQGRLKTFPMELRHQLVVDGVGDYLRVGFHCHLFHQTNAVFDGFLAKRMLFF